MGLIGCIDFILNLAALLLWFNWRSLQFDPLVKTSAASLAGTLRRAEPTRRTGWPLLLSLLLLLGIRAWVYAALGPAANWTPKLDLFVIVVPFRIEASHSVSSYSILLYSLLAFGRFAILAYFWMFFLNVVHQKVVDTDPVLRMVRLHLGRAARWHWVAQLLLPMLVMAALWIALHPLLLKMGIVGPVRHNARLVEQGLLVGAAILFSLKHLLALFLLLYLVTSYVYLGNSSFWDFVAISCRRILMPLRWLPLRLDKYDFAPLFWLVVLVLVFYAPVPAWIHDRIFSRHNLTLWPQ